MSFCTNSATFSITGRTYQHKWHLYLIQTHHHNSYQSVGHRPFIWWKFKLQKHFRRVLLSFLGNALSWLTGIATIKDVNSIKKRVNQLIAAQSTQQEAIVHIMSILKITRYTDQVNRQHLNIIMDTVDKTVHDGNNLYNITTSWSTSLSYYQLVLHIRSVLANLWDSLSYIRSVCMHIMDYINAATTRTHSPHILPIMDLKRVLSHIEETLPTTMHLPVSSEDTLHF